MTEEPRILSLQDIREGSRLFDIALKPKEETSGTERLEYRTMHEQIRVFLDPIAVSTIGKQFDVFRSKFNNLSLSASIALNTVCIGIDLGASDKFTMDEIESNLEMIVEELANAYIEQEIVHPFLYLDNFQPLEKFLLKPSKFPLDKDEIPLITNSLSSKNYLKDVIYALLSTGFDFQRGSFLNKMDSSELIFSDLNQELIGANLAYFSSTPNRVPDNGKFMNIIASRFTNSFFTHLMQKLTGISLGNTVELLSMFNQWVEVIESYPMTGNSEADEFIQFAQTNAYGVLNSGVNIKLTELRREHHKKHNLTSPSFRNYEDVIIRDFFENFIPMLVINRKTFNRLIIEHTEKYKSKAN